MASGLIIEVKASYALNYLIYIQNAVMNRRAIPEERSLKFPYLNSEDWHLTDDNFEVVFAEVWEEMLAKVCANPQIDHNGIVETERLALMKLFRQGYDGIRGYEESGQSFHAWFGGSFGQYAIERLIDNKALNELYAQLSPHTKLSKLLIMVIYDEAILTNGLRKQQSNILVASFHQLNRAYDRIAELIKRIEKEGE
ncbi:hypothetical protein PCCS19_38750 [Paenibacillus sp. CCS19]|uniref:hypothetical protein n=1 Tax=Paenibacillus sp. CCS19 TaxID=3158387 RepID=UPI0025631BBA|nr:hypothetical protein [Paenibacillus cellulosilyticus]GMK40819.1 hypothetical protein PCCS19_38750 [Paenibacillus cellulosilyticus]